MCDLGPEGVTLAGLRGAQCLLDLDYRRRDRLRRAKLRSIENHRILSCAQRSLGARAVALVAAAQVYLDLGEAAFVAARLHFLPAPQRAGLDAGSDVELHVGVGRD